MNLSLVASLEALIHSLFGGGVSIIGVFLTMVGLDLFTGNGKALRSHTWVSSINLYGLSTKFITFSTIICAAALDKIAPVVGIKLPTNVALFWTVLLIIYEIGSILENAHDFGQKITWLQKWLGSSNKMLEKLLIKTIWKTTFSKKIWATHLSSDTKRNQNDKGWLISPIADCVTVLRGDRMGGAGIAS